MRQLCRETDRLFQGAVIILLEIDRAGIDFIEQNGNVREALIKPKLIGTERRFPEIVSS